MELEKKAEQGDKEAAKKLKKYHNANYRESLEFNAEMENALRARLSRASRKTRARRKKRIDDAEKERDIIYGDEREGYDETVGAYRPKSKITAPIILDEGTYSKGGFLTGAASSKVKITPSDYYMKKK